MMNIVKAERPTTQIRQEHTALAIAQASAEQARRIADCLRVSLEALLAHLDQPCIVIDRNGAITQWNDALTLLTGIPSEQAVGKSLLDLLCLPAPHPLLLALHSLTPETTYQSQTWTAQTLQGPIDLLPTVAVAKIDLIPIHHVPGSLEALVLLIVPA